MKKIKVSDAVVKRLAHDITKIIPSKFKDTAFHYNYLIKEEDVEELLKLGEDLFMCEMEMRQTSMNYRQVLQ
ncbi:MAG: hypothetical protein AB2L14_28655 [Candidatus Xenobiia bacterium LiM19]